MSGPFGSSQYMYAAGADFYNGDIDQSMRFNDGDSSHLAFTPSSANGQTKCTISAWVKRASLGAENVIFHAGTASGNRGHLRFNSDDTLEWAYYNGSSWILDVNTSAKYRDTTSWYHVVARLDTTDGTADIYVNGTIQTLQASTKPSSSQNTSFGENVEHQIGERGFGTTGYFDGYLADVQFINGTDLTASSFGETKEGAWIPKEYTGSYGTNGFHLNFKKELAAANGYSHYFSGSATTFSHATHYDIGGSDDYTIEFWFKSAMTDAPNTLGYYQTPGPHFMVQLNGTSYFYQYTGNGAANTFTTGGSASFTANAWNHLAIVRSSGTMKGYVNGYQTTSGTTSYSDTTAWDTDRFGIASGFPGQPAFTGWITNVRLVVGSAVYTSNFTPSTTPLTNITNTKLLACQTTDLTKDNSSNNVTGSASGTVTAYTDSPFTGGSPFYFDKSGNDNHFTHYGLLPTDVVTDTPENNFATLNPLKTNGQTETYSEGNLRYASSQTSTNPAATSTIAVSSGKWYWEVYIAAQGNTANSVGIIDVEYGMENDSSAGYTSSSGVYSYQAAGTERSANTNTSYGNTWTTGDIIGVALDMDNGNVYFYKNGSIQNSGTALQGSLKTTGSGTYSSYSLVYSNGDQIYNFGQDSSFAANKTAQGNTDGNGVGNFFYSVPSGYLALCTANLSEPTLGPNSDDQPDDHFDAFTYTGNSASTRTISGVNFQPDMLWNKDRNVGFQPRIYDSTRGNDKGLFTSSSAIESTHDIFNGFTSDGFNTTTDGSAGDLLNYNGGTYISWLWKANGGTTTTNDASATGVGTIDSVYQANTTAGFSIVTYTGTGSAGSIAHGLGGVPEFMMIKNREGSHSWSGTYHHKMASDPETDYLNLSGTGGPVDDATIWNDTAPTSTVFTVGTASNTGSSDDFVAYLWRGIEGYSRFGSYVGTGSSSTGPYIHLGFKPALFVAKSLGTEAWIVLDNERPGYNPTGNYIYWNYSNTEGGAGGEYIDLLSNGVKIRTSGASANGSATFVYMAWAEMPFKYANAR